MMIYKVFIDSGDPSLNLNFGDVLYGIQTIMEAVNEKDAECKAIMKFRDNFYIDGDVRVTKIVRSDGE